jgi:hypothetical protein
LNPVGPGHESRLLCAVLCKEPAGGSRTVAELLQHPIDWRRFTSLALRHQVPIQVYRWWRETQPPIPPEVAQRLTQIAHVNGVRNQRLTSELLRLLALLQAQRIAAVPFKGPVLTQTIYGAVTERLIGDLDLFIPQAQMLAAHHCLLADGYAAQPSGRGLERRRERLLKSCYRYDEWYWKTLDSRDLFGARVELHWPTAPDHIIFPMQPSTLWDGITELDVLGVRVPSFALADLFLMLCINFSKDHWRFLRMVNDIASFYRRYPDLDWAYLLQQAETLGRLRALLLAFRLARDLLRNPVPELIAQASLAEQPALDALTAGVLARLFRDNGGEPGLATKIIYNLRLRNHARDIRRYLFFSIGKSIEGWTQYI